MKYRRPSRLRRIAKRVGLGVCVFLTTAWAVSTMFQFGVARSILPRIQHGTGNTFYKGKIIVTDPQYWFRCESLFQGRIEINGLGVFLNEGVWISGPFGLNLSPHHFGFVLPRSRIIAVSGVQARLTVTVPMWLPLVVFAIPTAILWRRDRRPRKGHCQHCGYNLTGNESGVCPECATPVPKRETTA